MRSDMGVSVPGGSAWECAGWCMQASGLRRRSRGEAVDREVAATVRRDKKMSDGSAGDGNGGGRVKNAWF